MAAATQTKQSPPELTSLQRVQGIPIFKDSLAYAHQTLSTNAYTHAAYNVAQAVSLSAYHASEPIQVRLAPLIVRADGLANMGLDAVQSRYPYSFEVQTDDVLSGFKAQGEAYQNAFDSRVKAPAFELVERVDSRFTPLVDRLEVALQKLQVQDTSDASSSSSESSASSSASTSQLSRAYRLSIELKEQIYTLSSEQVKQLREQHVIVQRAFETVENINATLLSTYSTAQEKRANFSHNTSAKVQEVGHNFQQELEKLQAATKQLPGQIQPFRDALAATIADLSQIVQAPGVPVSEKVTQIGSVVQEKVAPALKALREALGERGLISKSKGQEEEKEQKEQDPAALAPGDLTYSEVVKQSTGQSAEEPTEKTEAPFEEASEEQ
ncbi:hypothetical protein BOTBODRAFT_165185 [Botryobasidium botryosum FD-172 SS1]|uniref:Lipid droplet-associated perilipin protein n=1 Tax=Botryobasidium botryosum (strain FD-172 SS1) TaxID=930990 RepID=A0A067MC23_BOTB1|nr:hypothetical protein BOTBODRAFT_165185 [Botryobasidium botryosum FD-172 SS1]